MDKIILPFSVKVNDINLYEIDLSIPEAVAINNLEASCCDPVNVSKLIRRMTIGKKILLERCERYEMLIKFRSPTDIVRNEQELIEKSVVDFFSAKEAFLREMEIAS